MKKGRLHSIQINLLPKIDLNVRDKLLFFALHYLRYIIVLTQITVIGVFFYRFYIDQQIIDLREDVTQKQEILKITTPLINEAQATETRISDIKKLLAQESSFTKLLDFVFSTIPVNTTLDEVEMAPDSLTIKGQASSVQSVRSLYSALAENTSIKKAAITDITKSLETGNFQFIIVAAL